MYNYDLFCENMERYKSGERELSAAEKRWKASLSESFGAIPPEPFEIFLEYMEMYDREKSAGRHI